MNRVNYRIEQQKVEYKVWGFLPAYWFFNLMTPLHLVMLLPVKSHNKGCKYNIYLYYVIYTYTHIYTLTHFLFLSFYFLTAYLYCIFTASLLIILWSIIHGLWYFQPFTGGLSVSAHHCKAIILWNEFENQ